MRGRREERGKRRKTWEEGRRGDMRDEREEGERRMGRDERGVRVWRRERVEIQLFLFLDNMAVHESNFYLLKWKTPITFLLRGDSPIPPKYNL